MFLAAFTKHITSCPAHHGQGEQIIMAVVYTYLMNASSIRSLLLFLFLKLNNLISVIIFFPPQVTFSRSLIVLFSLFWILYTCFMVSLFPSVRCPQLNSLLQLKDVLCLKTTSYDLYSYLYILWDACLPPITGLSTTDDLLKLLCCPQGLGRCYLLHTCITAYKKSLAFALTKMQCSFSILGAQFA